MDRPTANARVHDLHEGKYYDVFLREVPRVGELVRLYSFMDQASGHAMQDPMGNCYEVVPE